MTLKGASFGGQLSMPSSDSPQAGKTASPWHWSTLRHLGRSRGCMDFTKYFFPTVLFERGWL